MSGKRSEKNEVQNQYDAGLARPNEGSVFESGGQSLFVAWRVSAATEGPCEGGLHSITTSSHVDRTERESCERGGLKYC